MYMIICIYKKISADLLSHLKSTNYLKAGWHLPRRELVAGQPRGGHEGLNHSRNPKAHHVAEGVAPGGRRHGAEAHGHAQLGVDVVPREDHEEVVAEAEAHEGDEVVQEIQLKMKRSE